jgi:biotin-dependent carboxylase-like uncharacterized protein
VIEILETGPMATVQDLGRIGHAALGVARAGAFDRTALRLGNRLVGNPDAAAAVEVTLGGPHARLTQPATTALTGAVCPGAPDWGTAVSLPAGAVLRLGTPRTGLRSYLAGRGGIAVEPVLGSRSTDTLSGIGPAPLRAGDLLPTGVAHTPVVGASAAVPPHRNRLPVGFGPRDDWFGEDARALLLAADWTVRPESNRVGSRLAGPALTRVRHGELPTEPTLPGALQVTPDGRPILFGPDAPVTGGYPVIAVVTDVDPAAQLRPGDVVRFGRAAG